MKKTLFAFLACTAVFILLAAAPVLANTLALVGNTDIWIRTDRDYNETLTIRNNGDQTVSDVSVSVWGLNISVGLPDDPGSFTLAPNESRSFNVLVFKESGGGNANETFRVTTRYTLGGTQTEEYEDVFVGVTDDSPAPTEDSPGSTPAPDNRAPNVIMTAPSSALTLPAGDYTIVDVVFKNSGNAPASNLTLTPTPSQYFQLTGGTIGSQRSLTVNNSLTTKLTIASEDDLEAGSYPVEYTYTYYDSNRVQYKGTATFYVKIENDQSTAVPSLVLKDFVISKDNIIGGDRFTVTATVENTAAVAAHSAQVTLGDLSPTGISMTNAVNNSFFDTVAPGAKKTVSFALTAYEKLKTNTYPVVFKLTYKHTNSDAVTTDYTNEYTYYIGVTNKNGTTSDADKALLTLTTVSPGGTYDTGQTFPVAVTVTNNGKLAAANVKITAVTPEGIVPKSASVQQVLTLAPGAAQALDFSFAPDALSKSQNYAIEFQVAYENGLETETEAGTEQETDSFSQYASANVVNTKADEEAEEEDDETKSIPKIIVSKYRVDPMIVQAGQEFDLYMTFQNTHSEKSVHNIKALLTVPLNEDGEKTVNVFSPIDASNTFFVDSIAPKGTVDQHIRLSTVPDAVAKNYVLVIQFDYEDADGAQITQSEEVGVNVKQNAKLELGEIPMPTSAMVEQPISLYFNVQNTGQVTLNNLKIRMVGDAFRTTDAEMIFGNFTSGSYSEYSGDFVPIEPGNHTIQVVVSYDEDTGEHVERVEEFDIMVEAMPDMDMEDPMGGMTMNPDGTMTGPDGELLGPDGMPIEGGFSGVLGFLAAHWMWILLGAAIAAGAVVTGVVFYRKRKKGLDFDE